MAQGMRDFFFHRCRCKQDARHETHTGTPLSAMAAAAWSWVEKMLQEVQVTSAPRAVKVSIKTAVWMVMWSEPAMRAPLRTFWGPYF